MTQARWAIEELSLSGTVCFPAGTDSAFCRHVAEINRILEIEKYDWRVDKDVKARTIWVIDKADYRPRFNVSQKQLSQAICELSKHGSLIMPGLTPSAIPHWADKINKALQRFPTVEWHVGFDAEQRLFFTQT